MLRGIRSRPVRTRALELERIDVIEASVRLDGENLGAIPAPVSHSLLGEHLRANYFEDSLLHVDGIGHRSEESASKIFTPAKSAD